ncbi:MAG: FUSC family protein [[Clostridium] scindens]
MRAIYAVRTALLLSLGTVLVQAMALPHGKWLLFTLASVSLPYADDVPVKIKKRVLATIAGGLASVLIYSFIPWPAGRTAAMMISGYISFYFTDYAQTFACSTVGAIGGAVFMHAFGLQDVGSMFLIRIGYILIGASIGYLANCLIFPYKRARATRQLWKKYTSVTELLSRITRKQQIDSQLYYNLVVQSYLLEEKLGQNANFEKWEEFPKVLSAHQKKILYVHKNSN